jgi:hypothetical protein
VVRWGAWAFWGGDSHCDWGRITKRIRVSLVDHWCGGGSSWSSFWELGKEIIWWITVIVNIEWLIVHKNWKV